MHFLRVYAPAELVTIVIQIITTIVIMVVAIIVSMSEGSLGSDTAQAIIFSTPTRPLHRAASRSKKNSDPAPKPYTRRRVYRPCFPNKQGPIPPH